LLASRSERNREQTDSVGTPQNPKGIPRVTKDVRKRPVQVVHGTKSTAFTSAQNVAVWKDATGSLLGTRKGDNPRRMSTCGCDGVDPATVERPKPVRHDPLTHRPEGWQLSGAPRTGLKAARGTSKFSYRTGHGFTVIEVYSSSAATGSPYALLLERWFSQARCRDPRVLADKTLRE